MTPALPARLLHRLEVMELAAVTVDASQVPERARVRFEVHAVSCGGGNPLPCSRILRDMTPLTNGVAHVGMLLDLRRALGNPHVELVRACKDRLLMAVVTRQLRVLAFAPRHLVVSDIHHVTPRTEFVRVLRVVPRDSACGGDARKDQDDESRDRDPDPCSPGKEPAENRTAVPEEKPQDEDGDNRCENDACLLNPRRDGREQESHDLRDTPGQR